MDNIILIIPPLCMLALIVIVCTDKDNALWEKILISMMILLGFIAMFCLEMLGWSYRLGG